MYAKYVTGSTVTDLGTKVPFLTNYTVVALNPGASAATLEFSDASTGPFTVGRKPDGTPSDLPAGSAIEVVVGGRYAAIAGGSGQVQIISD
jgi:hypothetical protein